MAAKKKTNAKKKSAAKKPAIKKPISKKAAPRKIAKKPMSAKSVVAAKPVTSMKAMAAASGMLTPLEDRIVVQPAEATEKTAGGIFIPGNTGAKPNRGVVLAKGRGRRTKKGGLRPLDVNVGDEVLFAEFAGTKLSVAGKEVLILREEDVLGVLG